MNNLFQDLEDQVESLKKNYYLLDKEDLVNLFEIVQKVKKLNAPKNIIRNSLTIREF